MGTPSSTRVALYSVFLNLTITAGKGVLAYLSGSTALFAETIHSTSDLVASFATFIGIYISHLKGSAFPLGLYKVENFVALISAGVIFFGGYEIIRESYFGKKPADLHYLPLAFTGLLLLSAIVYFFTKYESKKSEEFNSPALRADAKHLLTDIASTLTVLMGLAGTWLGYSFFDRLAAVIVVIFIARSGWRILVDAMKSLLDASVEPATLDIIRRVVSSDPRVQDINSIIARNSGSVIFIYLNLSLNLKSLKDAHAASEQIANAVRTAVPHVENIQIHYEPKTKDHLQVAVPLSDQSGAISDHFGKAPFIAIVKVGRQSGEVLEQTILPNPFRTDEKAKGINLCRFLIQKGVDVIYTREPLEGKGPGHFIEAADIQLKLTNHNQLSDVLGDKRYLEN